MSIISNKKSLTASESSQLIKKYGFESFCNMIENLSSLVIKYLFTENEFKFLINCLKTTLITDLDISNNEIENEGCKYLTKLSSLTTLDIYFNEITNNFIIDILNYNTTLLKINTDKTVNKQIKILLNRNLQLLNDKIVKQKILIHEIQTEHFTILQTFLIKKMSTVIIDEYGIFLRKLLEPQLKLLANLEAKYNLYK